MIWPWVPTDRRILDLNRKLKGAAAIITQLRADKARLTDANATLRRLVDIATETRNAVVAERNALREQNAVLERDLTTQKRYASDLFDEARKWQGKYHTQAERLALIDREEDMRDEDKAKRKADL